MTVNSAFRICSSTVIAVFFASAGAEPCPQDSGQRAAIEGYLTAMKEQRFGDAFDFVTRNMTDGRERADWASLQKQSFDRGEVKIDSIDVRAPRQPEGVPACDTLAIVPNILRSRDKFNTNGIVEFEVYNVLRDGGTWRIDSQETIYEEDTIGVLFPDVELVDAGVLD